MRTHLTSTQFCAARGTSAQLLRAAPGVDISSLTQFSRELFGCRQREGFENLGFSHWIQEWLLASHSQCLPQFGSFPNYDVIPVWS